jgi:hypothetical protein
VLSTASDYSAHPHFQILYSSFGLLLSCPIFIFFRDALPRRSRRSRRRPPDSTRALTLFPTNGNATLASIMSFLNECSLEARVRFTLSSPAFYSLAARYLFLPLSLLGVRRINILHKHLSIFIKIASLSIVYLNIFRLYSRSVKIFYSIYY